MASDWAVVAGLGLARLLLGDPAAPALLAPAATPALIATVLTCHKNSVVSFGCSMADALCPATDMQGVILLQSGPATAGGACLVPRVCRR
jgi:hypothetical protein